MQTRIVDAYSIPVNGLFVWQRRLWLVEEHFDDNFVGVRQLASSWTSNPYDRVIGLPHELEPFNGHCMVAEILSLD